MTDHQWFYAPSEEAVYRCNTERWHRHAKIPQCTCTQAFHKSSEQLLVQPELSQLLVASLFLKGEKYTMTGYRKMTEERACDKRNWWERFVSSDMATMWKIQLDIKGNPTR